MTNEQRPLRILTLVGGSYVSGAEIVALQTMVGLQSRGHELHCVANGWNDGDFISRLETACISYDTIKLGFISKRITELKYLGWTLNALVHLPRAWYRYNNIYRRFGPDLVLVHGTRMAAMIRPLLQPEETVYYVHGNPEPTFLTRQIMREGKGQGALYIGVSKYIERRISAMGVSQERTTVVYNGVDIPSSVDPPRRGSSQPTIGIVGQIGPWKGHDDLVEALRILRDSGKVFRCAIIGRGDEEYETSLRRRIERLGLSDAVQWRGFVEDTDEIYEDVDICAVPSRFSEPFGLVAAEAGARGIPVVATRRGGLPEIVEDGETGYLVDAEDPGALAYQLGRLLHRPDLRARMGENARTRMHCKFSKEQMIQKLEDRLLDCVSQKPLCENWIYS